MDKKREFYVTNSPYVYALNTPINAVDPVGNLVISVNGYFSRVVNLVGLAPGKPLEPYWNSFGEKSIPAARSFINAGSEEANYFVDG